MSYYLATKTSIVDWIKGLASENQVYFPEKHGQASYRFNPVKSDSDIQFERYTPTVVPPVKQLIPAREELLRFKKNAEGKTEVSLPLDNSFRILAGVRPCDLKGIFLMDLFFRDGTPDAYYLARRENTAIIGYACTAPCDSRVFCAAVDSLQHNEGADIFLTPLAGNDLLIEIKTELGKKLAASAGWQPCNDGPRKKEEVAQCRSHSVAHFRPKFRTSPRSSQASGRAPYGKSMSLAVSPAAHATWSVPLATVLM
jgi:hypothetical protein